jgi:O-antigen ligase
VKWVFFITTALLIWPLSLYLRNNYYVRLKVFVLMGFLPFVTSYFHLYMAIDSWDWIGYVRGGEISIIDLIAMTIYLSLTPHRGNTPFTISMAAYFIATVISAIGATFPITALFYSWQLARMFLLYATVYRGSCADPRVASAVLEGMAGGIFLEAVLAIWQRFGDGVLQTTGTYVHQNTLGLISHFVLFPFFALLLGGRRGWLPLSVVISCLIIEVLTTSRGTLAIGVLGLAIVFVLSGVGRWTSRKAMVLLAGLAAIAAIAPLAASSLQQRFTTGEISLQEDSERLAYKRTAALMLSEHPLGVGANNFTFVANIGGYFARAGEVAYSSGLSGNVHNVYWLVASETGYFGLVTFVILLLRPLSVALICGLRRLGDARGDLLLGLGVALLSVYIHSFEEWVFVTFDVQYLFAIEIGLVAGLSTQLKRQEQTSSRHGGSIFDGKHAIAGPRISRALT